MKPAKQLKVGDKILYDSDGMGPGVVETVFDGGDVEILWADTNETSPINYKDPGWIYVLTEAEYNDYLLLGTSEGGYRRQFERG